MTPASVRALFHYNETTGALTWARSRKGVPKGHGGGTISCGYVRITYAGNRYMAHRLIWLMHHGRWPKGDIDHINGDRADNRICNLREATRSHNCWNSPARKGKYKGVHQRGRKWRAQIVVKRRNIDLGSYDTDAAAARAYDAAARKYHGEFARPNFPEATHHGR